MSHPLDKVKHALRDCIFSLEYVNKNFPNTGGGASRHYVIEDALRSLAELEALSTVDGAGVRVLIDKKAL